MRILGCFLIIMALASPAPVFCSDTKEEEPPKTYNPIDDLGAKFCVVQGFVFMGLLVFAMCAPPYETVPQIEN